MARSRSGAEGTSTTPTLAGDSEPATPQQRSALWALGRLQGRSETLIRAHVSDQYGCSVETLTRSQMNAVITWAKRPREARL